MLGQAVSLDRFPVKYQNNIKALKRRLRNQDSVYPEEGSLWLAEGKKWASESR